MAVSEPGGVSPTELADSRSHRAHRVTWPNRPLAEPGWTEAAIAVGLLLLTVATRFPFLMRLPYAWDSVLFVRAVDLFNATIHQPQPPGYLLYVSAARLVALLSGDPHRALVWVSALSSGWAVATLYLLGRLAYDRLVGLIAAALLLTSVPFWYYSEVAHPYTTLAAGSTTLALIAIALRERLLPGDTGAAVAFLAFGLMLGFRQDLALFLAPLFLVALWGRPGRHWLIAVGAGALGVLLWLVPTAALSEGFDNYLRATSRQGGMASGGSSVFSGGLSALRFNTRELAIFLWHGLYLAVLPLGYLVARWLVSPRRSLDDNRWWLLLWLAPPLIFYSLAHIGDHGYTLSLLPGLMLLAARGVVLIGSDTVRVLAIVDGWMRRRLPTLATELARIALPLCLAGLLAAGNAYLFVRRQAQFTATGIECFDATMEARLDFVRERFPTDQTLVFSSGYYQHVRYLLPEYQSWFYEPAGGPTDQRIIDARTRHLVIFDEVIHPAAGEAAFEHIELPCNRVPFYFADVQPGDVARYDHATLSLSLDRGT